MSQTQILLCVPEGEGAEDTVERLVEALVPPLSDAGLAAFDAVQRGTWGQGFATVIPESHLADDLMKMATSMGHVPVMQIALDVSDTAGAEAEIARLTAGTDLSGTFHVGYWNRPTENDFDADEPVHVLDRTDGPYRSIEVYYDIADIPEGHGHFLDFRNAAMDLIETALADAGAGEWVGAESGANLETGELEVNFGFEVTDFDRAEKIVRAAVKGTPYEGIREITRYEETPQA